MLSLLAAFVLGSAESVRSTPAIYRMPLADAAHPRFKELFDDEFDTLCVDPAPSPALRQQVDGRLKFISPKLLDTVANRRWRDATIAFANGKLSPKSWVATVSHLRETVHWLSSPSTPALRDATPWQPADKTYSGRSVFAEMLLLSLPGKPCLTAGDCWLTRWLPDSGRLQSWILAMNDYRGPMLSLRHEHPEMVSHRVKVVRADAKPGLLVFHVGALGKGYTFFFNNAGDEILAPPIAQERMLGMGSGLDVEGGRPKIRSLGYVIVADKG